MHTPQCDWTRQPMPFSIGILPSGQLAIEAECGGLSDEVTALNILGRRMATTVLLIQALGGGWDRSNLPDRPECCGKRVSSNARP
jgi:hypothetical protein